MLREIATWLLTSCSRDARRFGYLGAAIGLESRARRCRAAWGGHLAACHQALRQSLDSCRRQRTALVLGSGLALEYPLAELAERFERVVLADLVHLPALRRHAGRYGNVELVDCDLSGILAHLARLPSRERSIDLAAGWTPPLVGNHEHVDWVVSCNLLSQLPLLPVAWLARRHPALAATDLERWGRGLMARHLDWLGTFAGERCLIADAAQTTRNRQGEIVEHSDLAAAFDLDRHAYASWEWTLAPPGELADGLSASHRVVACRWPAHSSASAPPSGNSVSV